LTSQTIGTGREGPPPARNTTPTPTPMARHDYTLHFLISIIRNSQPRRPSQQN
jgi:hypothetical protein